MHAVSMVIPGLPLIGCKALANVSHRFWFLAARMSLDTEGGLWCLFDTEFDATRLTSGLAKSREMIVPKKPEAPSTTTDMSGHLQFTQIVFFFVNTQELNLLVSFIFPT